MYLEDVMQLKQEISASLIKERRVIRTFSFSGNTNAFASTVDSLPGLVNGVGIMQNEEGYVLKLLLKDSATVSLNTLINYYGIKLNEIRIAACGPITLKNRIRPAFPGVSIGHYNVTAGTLGCYVTDKKGAVYILSNNHVIADSDKGRYRDVVLQPGPEDGGAAKTDSIAKLSYVVPLNRRSFNTMDAAIAKVDDIKIHTLVNNKISIGGTDNPALRMKVEKFGRTTGHTKGEVTTTHLDVNVEFEGMNLEFHDQFEVKGQMMRGVRTKFCNDGDSGSVILELKTHNAIGLLFAGTKHGTTFASPINKVLSAFSVNIL